MPSFAMTVPYMRTSPLYIPRRDLVLTAADSLYLRVTIIDSDNSCAQAIEMTDGIGSPSAQFIVWAFQPDRYFYEYGYSHPATGLVLWTGAGVTSDAVGAFDFSFPSGTMMAWPRRCSWGVQLNYDSQGADMLMTGHLDVRYGGTPFVLPPTILEMDDTTDILTDTGEQVLA